MDFGWAFCLLALLGAIIAFPIYVLWRLAELGRQLRELERRLADQHVAQPIEHPKPVQPPVAAEPPPAPAAGGPPAEERAAPTPSPGRAEMLHDIAAGNFGIGGEQGIHRASIVK